MIRLAVTGVAKALYAGYLKALAYLFIMLTGKPGSFI